MKKLIFLSAFFFMAISLKAQLGFSLGVQNMSAPKWEEKFAGSKYDPDGNNSFPTATYFSLSFSNRNKDKKFRFSPSLGYSNYYFTKRYNGEDTGQFIFPEKTDIYRARFINFNPAFDWYVFRNKKQNGPTQKLSIGQYLKRHTFIHMSPSISWTWRQKNQPIRVLTLWGATPGNISLSLRTGVGLDFQISDLLVITPLISSHFYPSLSWRTLGTPSPLVEVSDLNPAPPKIPWYELKSSVHQLTMEIKMQFLIF